MREIRLIVFLTFGVIFGLMILSGLLIFFEKGGAADFDILGQKFSSTNIGLAVLFLAISIFVYIVRDLYRSDRVKQPEQRTYITSSNENVITWEQVIDGAQKLVLQLTASTGFRPDLVIGICGGGLVVADIISKRLGHVPCVAIWPNRHSKAKSVFDGQAKSINQLDLDNIIAANSIKRILIVDDVVYSGGTLAAAVEYVTSLSDSIARGDTEVCTAAFFALSNAKFRPDFVAMSDRGNRKMMPISDRLR